MGVHLRDPGPGELGWIVQRHGEVYFEEYGWGRPFEALVAQVVASFGADHDPAREKCWIAELNGRPVGSIMLVQHPSRGTAVAKLRLLLVEPSARGRGVGKALMTACLKFAREAGYSSVVLWTNSSLHEARRMYERAGFRLMEEHVDRMFNDGEMAQVWELTL